MQGPAFYAYMAPEPAGYGAKVPSRGFYLQAMHEFVLMYDEVRTAKSPAAEILNFAQSTYAAGAELAEWDRTALERK